MIFVLSLAIFFFATIRLMSELFFKAMRFFLGLIC